MKTDRELLELAAKAAGINGEWCGACECLLLLDTKTNEGCDSWNPFFDDGDALWLAVKLRLDIEFIDECDTIYVSSEKADIVVVVAIGDIELRRAIVRAAAAIGEQMQ